MKLRNKPCVYCSETLASTKDHVPPQNLFCKPKPDNLITVPACLQCNNQAGKDEDYFLAAIMLSEAGVSEGGKRLWDTILPKMYKNNPALRGKIRQALAMKPIYTASGIFMGNKLTLKTEPDRLERVANKIARGLYYFEFNEPLPPNIEIEGRFLRGELDRELADKHNSELIAGSRSWPGIFRYGYGRLEDQKEISVWRLIFFEAIEFFIITGNPTL